MTTAWKYQDNGVFGGFNFFKKVYGTSSGSALFHENFSCAEIRQLPEGSTGTHAGKFPVFLRGNHALLPDMAHCQNLPVGKSQCKESLIHVEIFGEGQAEPVWVSRKFRFGNPVILAEGDHTACPRAPLFQQFPVIKDLGEQGISWQ